MIRRTPQ